MRRLVVSALLVLIVVAVPMSVVSLWDLTPSVSAEEIRLSTIVPDQTIVRGKDGAIGNNYRSKTDADVPDGNLIVEGNVGIGTTTPGAKLHISGGALRITDGTQDSQPNEISATAAAINYSTAGWHKFVINSDNILPAEGDNFDIYNVDTTGVPLLRVNTSGNVGIGTTIPNAKLSVVGGDVPATTNTAMLLLSDTASDQQVLNFGTSKTGNYSFIRSYKLGVGEANLSLNPIGGNVGIGTTNPGVTLDVNGQIRSVGACGASDLRWKENIATLDDPLEKISRLRGVEFDWKRKDFKENNFPEGRQIGMIAQEVEKEFPQLVTTDGKGYKAVAYDRFTAVLLEAIKSQQEEIQGLKKELKSENDTLKSKIEVLEARLNAK